MNKTLGGNTASSLKRNKHNRVVSKEKSKNAKKYLGPWLAAVKRAKQILQIPRNEFVVVRKGTELYELARDIYKPTRRKA